MQTIVEKLKNLLSEKSVSTPKSEIEALLLKLTDSEISTPAPKSPITEAFSKVAEKGLTPEGIIPDGTIEIEDTGHYDIRVYAEANVTVPESVAAKPEPLKNILFTVITGPYHNNSSYNAVRAYVGDVVPYKVVDSTPTAYGVWPVTQLVAFNTRNQTKRLYFPGTDDSDVGLDCIISLSYSLFYYDSDAQASTDQYMNSEYPKLVDGLNPNAVTLLSTVVGSNTVNRYYRLYYAKDDLINNGAGISVLMSPPAL